MDNQASFKFACPHCGQHLEAESGWIGMESECPKCGKTLTVPPPQSNTSPTVLLHTTPKTVAAQDSTMEAINNDDVEVPPSMPRIDGGHVHPMMDSSKSDSEKPTFDKWLLYAAQRLLCNVRCFLKFEHPVETDVSQFPNVASTFEFSRLFPLVVICLGFGWFSSWISDWQDLSICSSHADTRWAILPISALAVYGAFRAIRHFIRPKVSQWGAWIVTCLFTSMAGIVLLLAFQSISVWAVEAWAEGIFHPRNILMLAVVLIGLCYHWAMDPNTTILAKFIGFVGGVGLCEEATKLLPICLLILNRRKLPFKLDLSLRSFLMLGFFSGLGFGIGEALSNYALTANYESRQLGSQLIRWFACVPSHAIYTVIDAAFLWMLHRRIALTAKLKGKVGWFALCVAIAAFLHGIYDTLCGLLIMGPVLDAASLVLMWKVVRHVAAHHALSEDGEYFGLEDFDPSSFRTFGKSFVKTYIMIIVGIVIYAVCYCRLWR